MEPTGPAPSWREALRVWLRIGVLSVGGPATQIGLLHEEVVVCRRWVRESQFKAGLSFATLLPGPEAQQLATYLGYQVHVVRGAAAAGSLFVLPGAIVLMGLSTIAVTMGTVGAVGGLFWGLRAVVVPIAGWAPDSRLDGLAVALSVAAAVALFTGRVGLLGAISFAAMSGLIAGWIGWVVP